MTTIEAALEEIASASRGRRTAAFFDFDGTIIDGYSATALISHRARRGQIRPQEVARLTWAGAEAGRGRGGFAGVMVAAATAFNGVTADELDALGRDLLQGALGGQVYREAWELVAAHRRRGHTIVVASSAFPFQVEPLAREMGMDHVLCTRLEERDGVMTGRIEGGVLWGVGKADAVARFAADVGVRLEHSFGYANGDEDVDFLSLVGHARPVNAGRRLARMAEESGWPTMQFESRGRPGLAAVARTVAACSGMATAFGAGLGVGLVNRSRRDAVNLTIAAGSEAGLALAGIRVAVNGEEHLWSHRPAVFIFNHQSWLDGLIVMKLLRSDVTGVATQELARQPGFGPLAWLADMAFVDGDDTAQANDALRPVVERLAQGCSVAMAPEGTRSSTPRVGPFNNGAFQTARQGGVPVVPVVIRNTGELLWRGSTFVRPGTVDVAVLPPIPVADWSVGDLDERVEEVRNRFVETLARMAANRYGSGPRSPWPSARGTRGR